MMPPPKWVGWALHLYEGAWRVALPLLHYSPRLQEGFAERMHARRPFEPADVWIQAASVGEAYLAGEIARGLAAARGLRLLLTTQTPQGLSILRRITQALSPGSPAARAVCRYFPFDRPAGMRQALRAIRPQVVVLLETEIWPGLLGALSEAGVPCLLVNGRLSRRSLRRYRLCCGLWRHLRPDRILAVSRADAARFAELFGAEAVGRMPNIKFDRLAAVAADDRPAQAIGRLLPAGHPFVVLGSVRRQEEPAVREMIRAVLGRAPSSVIGLFPRHLERVPGWQAELDRIAVPWALRSRLEGAVAGGTVILWDTIGELAAAYGLACSAFVGGSLAPLGGQNFLEAVANGIRPVIGPHWDNFAWVGPEARALDLLRVAADWKEAAERILEDIRRPAVSTAERLRTADFIRSRQGGTRQACTLITSFLNGGRRRPEAPMPASAPPTAGAGEPPHR